MLERIALLALLVVAAVGAFQLLRLAHVRRMQPAPATGAPTVLYFRGDSCAACPTQSRFLEQVAADWDGRLIIERIDAEREPEKAARYSVFSLPTTILVDAAGQIRHVNYGLADVRKLSRQLSELAEQAQMGPVVS